MFVKLALAQPENCDVVFASGRAPATVATTKVSVTDVIAPGITPLVSAIASTPPAITSKGSPAAITPLTAAITPI